MPGLGLLRETLQEFPSQIRALHLDPFLIETLLFCRLTSPPPPTTALSSVSVYVSHSLPPPFGPSYLLSRLSEVSLLWKHTALCHSLLLRTSHLKWLLCVF